MPPLSEVVCRVIRTLRVDTVVRATIARRRVSILMYHRPSPACLEEHLRYLSSCYNLIRLDSFVDALRSGDWHRVPDRALVLTFDDGAAGVAALADVLRRHRAPATMYLCSSITGTNRRFWFEAVPDPYALLPLPNARRLEVLSSAGFRPDVEAPERTTLSPEELERMADVVDFQSHTRFHPPLTTCTDDEADDEIQVSRSEVESLTRRPCRHLCYPHGDYGDREEELARRAGYRSARTIDIGWNGPRTNPYRLRILGTLDDASVARLAGELSGIGFLFRWRETRRLDGRAAPLSAFPKTAGRAGSIAGEMTTGLDF
ncbi:MAG TPA: polysaccharide deacetylase family protein [Gaiellaceae bacterium]|nr:polysaccharide deacetylase family protein [Gaiellaceae bacterium]